MGYRIKNSAPKVHVPVLTGTGIIAKPVPQRTGSVRYCPLKRCLSPEFVLYLTLFGSIRTVLPFFHTARRRPLFLCRSTTWRTAFFNAASALSCNVILFFMLPISQQF